MLMRCPPRRCHFHRLTLLVVIVSITTVVYATAAVSAVTTSSSGQASTIAASHPFDEDFSTNTTAANNNSSSTSHGNITHSNDDTTARLGSDGNTVCRSVIAYAKSRIFHHDDDNDDDDDETFVCELPTGDIVPITATPVQVTEMQNALYDGTLVSGVSTIIVQEVHVATEEEGVEIIVPLEEMEEQEQQQVLAASSGGRIIKSVTFPPGSIRLRTNVDDNTGTVRRGGRSLANYAGNIPILAVRVTDVDGLAPSDDANYISDKIFGTNGDDSTAVSQFSLCSYGAFNIVNNDYGSRTAEILSKLSAPGVLDVTIPISIQPFRYTEIYNALTKAVSDKLGFPAKPGPFAHIIYILEKCYASPDDDCKWLGLAQVNRWSVVVHSKYFSFPTVILHEIGHNLNFGHSGGFDGGAYSDRSCLMGYAIADESIAGMCFNPAKTHQLIMSNGNDGHSGYWYDASRVSTWTPGSSGNVWNVTLIGVAEYGQITNGGGEDRRLVLRILHDNMTDLFVGFNRKTGMNKDTKQGSNMVTIIQAGAGGITYSASFLNATLQKGQSFNIPNWQGIANSSLKFLVDEIRTDVVPGYANVRVVLSSGQSAMKNLPTSIDRPGKRSKGVMFTVSAKKDVIIWGMDVVAKMNITSDIMVYTRNGSYHEVNSTSPIQPVLHSDEWQQIYSGRNLFQPYKLVSLSDFDSGVSISTGQIQSFYVNFGSAGILYGAGNVFDAPVGIVAEDENIIVYEGQSMRGHFQKVGVRGKWNGVVRYRTKL